MMQLFSQCWAYDGVIVIYKAESQNMIRIHFLVLGTVDDFVC